MHPKKASHIVDLPPVLPVSVLTDKATRELGEACMKDIASYCDDSKAQEAILSEANAMLASLLAQTFPQTPTIPFSVTGSFATGVCNKYSDIDVTLSPQASVEPSTLHDALKKSAAFKK